MAELKHKLMLKLSQAEAHREIIKHLASLNLGATALTGFRYNKRTGQVLIATRAFQEFGELEKESEESKIVNQLLESAQSAQRTLQDDHKKLDKREAQILSKERAHDKRVKNHEKKEKQLIGERKQFDKDRGDVVKKGLFTGIKSFFHTQT